MLDQRVVISDTESSWRPVASSVPLGCILGLVLLIILISDLDDGIECSVSQFADNTKLGEVADMPEGHSAIQGDHSKLEKWSDRKLMKFDKKSKSLHPCTGVCQGGHTWKTALQNRATSI